MTDYSESAGPGASPAPSGGISAKRPQRRASSSGSPAPAHAPVSSARGPVPIENGTLIGDYRVYRRLDAGGMGTVYAAVHPVIGKKVAIKVLHPHVARQEEAVARFIQEARAVNSIGHPGIVDIFGFGRFVDGRHYMVMEYLDGQQLLEFLNEHGPIDALHTLDLSRQIAESLAAAHTKAIVHRDMKPENVFLIWDPEGNWPPRTKILDFGLAKLIEAGLTGAPRTRAGVTVGTPYYMSPEQCRGKPVDRRADVYALGVMTYEMITGRVPFYAAESVDVLYMHLTQDPEPPSKHRAVPPDIEEIILRCMSKVPDERPDSMEELVSEIDRVVELLAPVPVDGAGSGRSEEELMAEAAAFFGAGHGAPDTSPGDGAGRPQAISDRPTPPFGSAILDAAPPEDTHRADTEITPAVPALPSSQDVEVVAEPTPAVAEVVSESESPVPSLPVSAELPVQTEVAPTEPEAEPAPAVGAEEAESTGIVARPTPSQIARVDLARARPHATDTEAIQIEAPPRSVGPLWVLIAVQFLVILVLTVLLISRW